MRYEQAGVAFEAVVQGFPSGLTGTIGVRVRDNQGADTLARTTAGIAEDLAGSGIYRANITIPTEGDYSIVWDKGGALTPSGVAIEDVTILGAAPVPPAPSGGLIAEALTTVADMEIFLDRPASGTTETAWLEQLINSYSLAVARYCDRQFTPERTGPGTRWPLQSDPLAIGIAKKFRYDGNGILTLTPFEIRTVTSVVMDTDLPTSQQTTLGAGDATHESDYRFEPPAKSTEGTYLWAVLPRRFYLSLGYSQRTNFVDGDPLPGGSGFVSGQVGREVTVTGNWGAPPGFVPLDVQHACKIAVGQAFRNPEDYATRTGPGMTIDENVPPAGPGSLPPESMRLLSVYRRP